MGLDFGSVRKSYMQEVCEKTYKTGKLASSWGILLVILLVLIDIYMLDFSDAFVWRVVGVVPMLFFGLYALTYQKKHSDWVIPLNVLILAGLGIMMAGTAYEVFSSIDPPMKLKYGVALGYTGILFLSLIIAEGARPYLPYIIIIPLAILTILLLLNDHLDI